MPHVSDRAQSSRTGAAAGWIALAAIGLVALLWVIWNGEAVSAFKREAGPVGYFAAMAVLPALGFPLTPFFVLAGATFGTGIGLIGSAIALALNLSLCYWIASSGLRTYVASVLERYDYELPDFRTRQRGIIRFVAVVKVTPGLPGFAKNYLLGLAGVPFWTYLFASLAFTGTYALALVWIGESLVEHDIGHLVLGALAIAVVGLGVWWWKKRGQADSRVCSEAARPP